MVVHLRTPSVVVASEDDVVFEVWSANSDIEGVRAVNRELSRCGDRLKGKMIVMSVVTIEGLMQFSDDLRRESIDRLKRIGPKMRAGSLTLPTQNFAATMVRSLLSGIFLVFRPPYAYKVCANAAESASFISRHVEGVPPAIAEPRILRALTELGAGAPAP